MSIRKILKNRITELTKQGVENANTNRDVALESLIRLEEAKHILKLLVRQLTKELKLRLKTNKYFCMSGVS